MATRSGNIKTQFSNSHTILLNYCRGQQRARSVLLTLPEIVKRKEKKKKKQKKRLSSAR